MFLASYAITKPQRSIEMVASSPSLFETLEFTGGLFTQRRELHIFNVLDIDQKIIAQWTEASSTPPNPPPDTTTTPPDQHENTTMVFNQIADSLAGYGQLSWNFAQRWTLIGGARVTKETRTADWNRTIQSPNPPGSSVIETVLGYQAFTDADTRSEVLTLPKIALRYKPTKEISLFAHWAQGARSGGFNADSGRGDVKKDYDAEVVTERALSAKTILLDGAVRLNAGWFRMDLKDFQLQTLANATGSSPVTITTNAGSARSQGYEADLTWLPFSWLTLIGAAGNNDSTFTDFRNGPCARGRVDTDGNGDRFCDLTGAALPFAPKWTSSLTMTAALPLASIWPLGHVGIVSRSGIELQAGATMEYESLQTTGLPGDERQTQPAYQKYNAHFGFGNPGQRWSIRITGDNLTNVATNRGSGQITSSTAIWQQLEPPRNVYGAFTWEF